MYYEKLLGLVEKYIAQLWYILNIRELNGWCKPQWRIQEFENGGAQLKAGGLGAALRPPVGPGRNPGGGPGGEAPMKLLKSRYFERQNHVIWRANFYLFSRHFSH